MTKKWRSLVGKKVRLIGFFAAFCAVVANARERVRARGGGAMPNAWIYVIICIVDCGRQNALRSAKSQGETGERNPVEFARPQQHIQ